MSRTIAATPAAIFAVLSDPSLHAVIDVGVLYGDAPPFDVVEPGRPGSTGTPRTVLLIDAGGTGVGVVADRVLGLAEGDAEVLRPRWDALFGA